MLPRIQTPYLCFACLAFWSLALAGAPVFSSAATESLPLPKLERPGEDAPVGWIPTWTTAVQRVEPHNEPPDPGFTSATVRQKFNVSIGGDALRLRFSNAFGDGPVTLEAVGVAPSTGGGTIDSDASRPVRFAGRPFITLEPGSEWISDPIPISVKPMGELAVTFQINHAPEHITGHPGSRTTSFFAYNGEPVDAGALPGATRVDRWYYLAAAEVIHPGAAAVAIVGDSITDGRGSTTNGNDRWPDWLSRKLRQNPETSHIAVLNQGIGGNRVLRDGLGPHLLSRLDRDVLAQPGVRWLILFQGINDLGTAAGARAEGRTAATAETLISAYDQVIRRARAHGIRVFGATLTPFMNCFYFSEQGEADRQAINAWIRESDRFDAVLDFDAIVRDPENPAMLLPAYDTGDHLHLNQRGLRAIGKSIDLTLFAE